MQCVTAAQVVLLPRRGAGGNELEQQHPLLHPLGQLRLTSHRQNLCVPGATVLSSHHAAMGTLPAEEHPLPS